MVDVFSFFFCFATKGDVTLFFFFTESSWDMARVVVFFFF